MIFFQELKYRAYYFFWGYALSTLTSYYFRKEIWYMLLQPLQKQLPQVSLTYTDLTEIFLWEIKLSLLIGFLFQTPFLWLQITYFLWDSLYFNEKKFLGIFLSLSWLFLVTAFLLCFKLVLPQAWVFFLKYNSGIDNFQFLPTVKPYVKLCIQIWTGLLLIFQTPLLFLLSIHWSWVDLNFLLKNRKWFIFLSLVLAAMISPPDLFSQIFIFTPLFIFYEIMIFILIFKKNYKKPKKTKLF